MSIKKVHGEQPKEFKFSTENLKKVEEILKRYPDKNKKSAVMPLLYLAQRQNENWIPLAAMKYIANYLAMPYISVYEVATFYSMYNHAPVGKNFIQVCTTTPCLIRQINDDYYEDLDEKSTTEILDSLIKDKPLKPGSYRGRKNTAPEKLVSINGGKHA